MVIVLSKTGGMGTGEVNRRKREAPFWHTWMTSPRYTQSQRSSLCPSEDSVT